VTSTATSTPSLVSLSDIAAMAGVRRPVPSTWRRRWAGSETPFPDPAERVGAREFFDLGAVVDWLEQTGLGNSRGVREEAALFASLEAQLNAAAVLDGLEALVALTAVSGAALADMDAAALLDLADDADPRDGHLYRELVALGESLPFWAARAGAMVEAAFGVHGTLEVLARHRSRLGVASPTRLHPSATRLAASIALELVAPEERVGTVFVDPVGAAELLLALPAGAAGESPAATLPPTTTSENRSVRRRLVAAGWDVGTAEFDDGRVTLPDGCTVLAQLPSASCPVMSDLDVVTAIDEISLAMHDADHAVVIGPASALANRARDALTAQVRAGTLRTEKVRAILRLPAGLWPARSRQQLAMWVLGPPPEDGPGRDQSVAVADIPMSAMSTAAHQDVVMDVVAAVGGPTAARGHAFRFARLVPMPVLAATAGELVSVVAPVARPRQSPVEIVLEAQRLAAAVSAPAPGVSLDLVRREHGGVRTATLGQLLASQAVRVIPGNRIDAADLLPGAPVPVIGPDELLGARRRSTRGVDRLSFASRYASGRYTEPGDVVFCTTPSTGALVDGKGLSVVLYPARVLRIDPEHARGLTPELLAHTLRTGPGVGPWRAWPVRLVPPAQATALESALRDAETAREDARQRLDALDALTRTLVDGVSTGALTLNHPTEPDHHTAEQEG
jgi:hypothetical protein